MNKHTIKLSCLITLFICTAMQPLFAQTRADIFNRKVKVTWLGIDFSQLRFIGSEAAFKDEVINPEFVGKYFPVWNNFFIKEPSSYNPAKAINRDSVGYALSVTEKVNNALTKNFFDENPNNYGNSLTEKDIAALVKNYDFQGRTGIGMMIFAEGLSKPKKEGSGWVTFVNMNDKTVLMTVYQTGSASGFGFKNFWAHTYSHIIKNFGNDFDTYKAR